MHRSAPRLLPLAAAPLLALALAACAQPQQAPSTAGTCRQDAAEFAVGYVHTDLLVAEALRRSGARVARVVRPDDQVTMDYSPQRVTLELGADNRVERVRCG